MADAILPGVVYAFAHVQRQSAVTSKSRRRRNRKLHFHYRMNVECSTSGTAFPAKN